MRGKNEMNNELKEAAVEINSIFKYMELDILNKIPDKIKIFFKNIASDKYIFEYDQEKPLKEQNIKNETKGIIALLYRDYICTKEEKEEYIKKYNQYIENVRQSQKGKSNVNDIFKNANNKNKK